MGNRTGNRMRTMKDNLVTTKMETGRMTTKMLQRGVKLAGAKEKRILRGTITAMKLASTTAHGDKPLIIKAIATGVNVAHMGPRSESRQIDPRPGVTITLISRTPRGNIAAASIKNSKMIHGKRAMTRKMGPQDGTRATMHPRIEDREVQDPQTTGIKIMMTEQENGATTTIESIMTGTRTPGTVTKKVLGVRKAMEIRKTTTGGIAGVIIETTETTTEAHHTEIRKRPHKAGVQVHHPNPKPEVLRNQIKGWSGEMILVTSGRDVSKRFIWPVFFPSQIAT